MLKFFATDVSVSKGFNGNPALRFYEAEGVSKVRFRVGKRVYDSRCENNCRYINLRVKASGDLCERIRKMKLKDGSFINISGRYDEETIKDDETNTEKTYPVIILDDIKFCYSGGGKKNGQSDNEGASDGYGTPPASQYGSGQYGTPASQPQAGFGTPPASQFGGGQFGGMPQGATPPAQPAPSQMPENFTGYESFGGMNNPFYPG